MLFGSIPSVSVFGVKVNGMESGANLIVGPSSIWGFATHTKDTHWTHVFGDFGYTPMITGIIFDNDFYDHPINDIGPA
ncbi:MAG: hypothetical protein ACM3XM_15515 [Mycobacterium leprae]